MLSGGSHISPEGACTQGVHSHSHTVTKCLRDVRMSRKEAAGGLGSSAGAVSSGAQKQEARSVVEMLTEVFQRLSHRTSGIFGKGWNGTSGETGSPKGETGSWQTGKDVPGLHSHGAGVQAAPAEKGASEVLAAWSLQSREGHSPANAERLAGKRRVGPAEGGAGGGLRRGQEGRKHFLQQSKCKCKCICIRIAAAARRLRKSKMKEASLLPEKNTGLQAGKNSWLLDSYNSAGEYSTLAGERSQEGSFQARG